MQLTFDEATEAFRHEFVAWLDANAPPRGRRHGAPPVDRRRARRGPGAGSAQLFDAGWLVPGNPPEYGGRNATLLEQFVHHEELARRSIYASFNPQGLGIIAPSILTFGTDEQKRALGHADPAGRDHRRPRHERAQRRLRPRRPAHPGRARRRPLRRQRPEGVDLGRPRRRRHPDLRPHRPRRARSTRASAS